MLGVSRTASKAEIRHAYLELARLHHPDFNPNDPNSPSQRTAAAPNSKWSPVGIREVNAAWAILGDDRRRSEYDQRLDRHTGASSNTDDPGRSAWMGSTSGGFRTGADGSTSASRINRPRGMFVPHDPGPDPSDEWRYTGDTVNDATVPPKLLLAAPPLCLLASVGTFIVWLVVGSNVLMALAIMLLFMAGLLFVGAPLVAMAKSQNEEQRAQRRR